MEVPRISQERLKMALKVTNKNRKKIPNPEHHATLETIAWTAVFGLLVLFLVGVI